MALRFIDSFDHYSTNQLYQKWTSGRNGTPSNFPTAGRFGNGWPGTERWVMKRIDQQQTWILGCALQYRGQEYMWTAYDPSGGASQWYVCYNGTAFEAYRGSKTTLLGTSSAVNFPTNVWRYVEVKVKIDNTTGTFDIRIDGQSVLSLTGLDTQVTANASASDLYFGDTTGNNTGIFNIDDVYMCDGTGSAPTNDFLGDVRIEALFPNGNGNSSQLTGSDGNSTDNYQLVDETPPATSDYVETSTVGNKDTYTYTDLTPAAGTVYGVQPIPYAEKTDAGVRSIRSIARLSGTETESADEFLFTNSYTYFPDIRETKPGGGVWTIADVNNAEFGVKVSS